MKIAIVGSRKINVTDIERYVSDCEEIVSGGARGVDTCAAEHAKNNGIKLTVFIPQYERYGRAAPIVRNKEIVDYADKIIAFWDGKSNGTKFVIDNCRKLDVPIKIYLSNR